MEIDDQQQPAEDIDAELSAIWDKAESGEYDETPPEIEPDGRERDDKGRFVAKAEDAPEDETPEEPEQPEDIPEAAEASPDEPEVPPEESPEDPEDDFPFTEAPNTWRKEVAAKFKDLPREVQAEIHRRENDFHAGIGQYRQMAQVGQAMDKAIQPFAHDIVESGSNAPALIGQLLQTQRALYKGTAQEKAQTVAGILRDYQVDTDLVNQYLGQPAPPPPDPTVARLSQTVESLQHELSQSRMTPFMDAVNAFMDDAKNEFAAELQPDMIALLNGGRAKTLDEAYRMAKWSNPSVRAKLEARRQAADRKRRAEQAARAKKAGSVNVTKKGTPPTDSAIGTGTMDQTLEAAYERATAGS